MKQFILMSAMALGTMATQAQDYKTPLTNTWAAFDTTKDINTKTQLSNKLTLIAKKWPNEWAPHYYASLSKTILAYDEKDETKHDAILDEADKEKEDAVAILGKDNDETYVLAAMIANCRMIVNPMQRWQKYGKIYTDNLTSAKEANPNNPRMYYLKAVSTMYTPKNFGGGKKAALPYFEKADGLFAKEDNKDINKPYWGKTENTYFMAECRKEDKE